MKRDDDENERGRWAVIRCMGEHVRHVNWPRRETRTQNNLAALIETAARTCAVLVR